MSDVYERMQNALNNSKELKKKNQNPDNDVYSRIDSAFETVRQQKIKNGTYESPVKKANDWIQTVNSFRKDVGSIKPNTYSSKEVLTDYNSRVSELNNQRNELITQLNKNKRLYGVEDTERAIEALSAINFDDVNSALSSYSDYFSQWENESAFNYAKAQDEKKKRYSAMTDEELDAEIEKNKEGNKWYNKVIDKVAEIGSYIPTTDANTPISTITKQQQAQKTVRGAVEQSKTESLEKDSNIALLQQEKNNRVLKEFETLPTDVKNLLKGYVEVDRTQDESNINKINEGLRRGFTGGNQVISQQDYIQSEAEAERLKQLQQYRQALNNSGVKNWEKYLDAVRIQSDGEYYKETREQTKEFAEKYPVASSIGSVLMAPTKMLGAVEMLESALDKNSEQLNYNSPYFVGNRMSEDIRNTVMENHDWVADENSDNYFKNKDWFDTFYGLAMSSGDTLLNTAIGGGVPGVAGAMLGVEAATDTAIETAENGGSKWDALVTGTIAGVNEALFEKISIGNLKSMATKDALNYFSKNGVKTIVANLAKSAGINATEEMCTEAANIVTDYLINGGTSSFVENYNAGLAQGLSEAEAKKQAYTAMVSQIGEAGVSGALQGLLFGGVGSATAASTQKINEVSSGKIYSNKEYMALREEAEKLGIDVSKYSYANNGKVGRLETVVAAKKGEKARADLINRAEDIGLDTRKYNTRTVEGFEKLTKAFTERSEAINNELLDSQYVIFKYAFKHRLIALGENSTKANDYSTFLAKMYLKGESMPENVIEELERNVNVYKLKQELNSGAEWVDEADSKVSRALDEIEKRYQIKRDETREAEIDEKIEALSSSEDEATAEATTEITEDVENPEITVEDENTVKSRIKNRLKNSAVMESAGDMYDTLFDEYYNAGLKGIGSFESFDKLATWTHEISPEVYRREIYESAKNTRFNDPGVHRMYQGKLDSRQQAQVDILKILGEKFDISFIVADSFDGEGGNLNGFYLAGTNKVGIALDAEGDLYLRTAGHECYHYIEEWNKKGAVELRDMVIDYLKKSKDYNYKEQVERYAKAYKLNAVENIDAIHSEMVADCMFDVFSNERFVKGLVNENKTLAQKVCDFIKELLSEIRRMISNYHNSPEMEALRDMKALLETINKNFEYQLEIAFENAKKAKNAELQSTAENSEQKNNTTEDSGVIKYSLMNDVSFKKNVEAVINMTDEVALENKKQGNFIRVMDNTPSVILDNVKDAGDYEVIIRFDALYLASRKDGVLDGHYHNLGKNIITKLPEYIENPDAVVRMKDGRLNIFATVETSKGNNGIISMEMNAVKDINSKNSKYNLVVSVFSAGENYTKNNILKNGVEIEYKKEDLPQVNHQLYEWLATINDKSSTNSISNLSPDVNGNQKNNSEAKKSIKLSPDAKKVLEENPELKQVFEYLQKQFKLARKTVPSEDQLMRYAEEFKKNIPTILDVYKLKTEFRNIYSILTSMTDSRGLEYVTSATFKLAEKILKNSKVLDKINQDKKLLREQLNNALKNRKFKLTPEMQDSINEHYGSWNDLFKNGHGIARHLNKEASVTLEDEWNDLCAELPDLLDVNTHRDDQLFALIEAFDITDVEYGYNDEYVFSVEAQSLATEILSSIEKIFFDTIGENSLEDRHALEMNELREKTDEQIKKLKKKHQDNLINKSDYWRKEIKKKAEQKRMTENRNKIEKQLVRLAGMLAKGTKNRHVPIQLIESVKELCEMFVLRNSKQTKLSELLGKVEANYDALVESDDYTFRNAFSNEVAELINQLNKDVGNKSVNSMTADELEQVNEVVRAIAQKVSRSNQLFIEGRKETATEMALNVLDELTHQKTVYNFKRENLNKFLNTATATGERFGWKLLKPVYAFRLIGSDTLIELEKNLRKGEDVWAVDLGEAKERFTKLAEEYHHNDWKEDKATVHLFQGDATLTVQQLMFLYCAFQRKQFVPHLLNGGFVFEKDYVFQEITDTDETGTKIKDKNGEIVKFKRYVRSGTVRLHEADFEAIKEALTAEQRAYADSMRDYLAVDMGEKGNSVYRRLYDHNKFTDSHYFPIKVARQYIRVESKDAGEKSVLAWGAAKEVQEKAKNPVLLRDFDTVWAEHVQGMSTYHAFALRIDDFNKVFNYHTESTVEEVDSVKAKLEAAWGKEAVNYVETFLKDVNGRLRVDDGGNFLTKGISNFKKASVLMSASVIIQQPSAIVRAMSEVNLKYFTKTIISKRDYDEVMKYAPIAKIKAMGFFDTGIGPSAVNWLLEPTYEKDKIIKGLLQDGDYRKKAYNNTVTYLPEIMDELTWAHIWNAVKAEQKDLNKNLDGEELLKKTVERFTEVIELTQVYDSVFSKSEIMRSKDTGAKMATAFMAEPTVSLNMYVDAVVQGKRTSKRKMARIITCVVFSSLLNAILKSMVAASRDDDEKKTQLEKYISAVLSNWVNDVLPWNMVPIARDVASIFNGYDVERSDMSVITSLYNVLLSCLDDEKSTGTKFIDVAGAVAALFGVPLKNVVRDIRAGMNLWNRIWNTEKDIFDLEWAAISLGFERNFNSNIIVKLINGGEKKNSDYMYEAIKRYDMDRYYYLVKELGSPEAVHKAMMQGLKDNDSRVLEAAQYRLKGDSVSFGATIKEMVSDNFPEKQVVAAVNSVYKDITEETEEESPEKEKSIYNSVDLYNAVNSGTNYTEIIDDMIEVEMANGKTEEQAENTVRDRVNDYWKEEFLNASESEQEVIRDKLDKTGLYEDVEETTNNWLKAVLLERYDEATSYSQRKMIENQLYALGVYKDRNSLKAALKRRTEDDSEEK